MVGKTNISLINPNEANDEVMKLYNLIESLFGRVAPTWRALAHKPEYLKLVVDKFALLFGESKLDIRTKLLVYLTVSIMNNCPACIYAFSERLKLMGLIDEEFVELYSVIDAALANNAIVNAVGITPELLQEIIQESKK